MMTKTGMLIVTNPNKFVSYISRIRKEIKNTLYVQLLNQWQFSSLKNISSNCLKLSGPLFSSSVLNLYRNSLYISNIDVRVLLGNLKNSKISTIDTKKPVEVVYFDEVLTSDDLQSHLKNCVTNRSSNCQLISLGETEEYSCEITGSSDETYDNVVLGGTFDRLHPGHKILLSEAVLRCNKKLTVGVTSTEMLKKILLVKTFSAKKLWELIEPCEVRIKKVQDFLEDVDPGLEYNVVPISDMFGPTKDDPTFQMLVVSSETVRGGAKVNEVRQQNGLKPLVVHSVDLLTNIFPEDDIEEDKISSSNERIRLLGKLLRPPKAKNNLPKLPYIIGLIGGIASGKSSICKRLVNLGAGCINCDEIAHNIYKKGMPAYDRVINTFGTSILDEKEEISRKALGNIVFKDKDARNKLNNILWPAILERSKEMAKELMKQGKQIIMLEAAVLLEAGWSEHCHELWACIIPPEEAIRRLQERNNLSEEEAKQRLSSQPSNTIQVENANLVFCTLWKPQFTQKQVERAWKELNERLELNDITLNAHV